MRLYPSLQMLRVWHDSGVYPQPAFREALEKVLQYMEEKVIINDMIKFSEEKNYE